MGRQQPTVLCSESHLCILFVQWQCFWYSSKWAVIQQNRYMRGTAAGASFIDHHIIWHLCGGQEAFLGLDHAFQRQQDREWDEEVRRKGGVMGSRPHAGCTIITALLHHNHLWVANAGATVNHAAHAWLHLLWKAA